MHRIDVWAVSLCCKRARSAGLDAVKEPGSLAVLPRLMSWLSAALAGNWKHLEHPIKYPLLGRPMRAHLPSLKAFPWSPGKSLSRISLGLPFIAASLHRCQIDLSFSFFLFLNPFCFSGLRRRQSALPGKHNHLSSQESMAVERRCGKERLKKKQNKVLGKGSVFIGMQLKHGFISHLYKYLRMCFFSPISHIFFLWETHCYPPIIRGVSLTPFHV